VRTCDELGLRTVVVSNTFWRDAAAYLKDFSELGLEIHGAVTSLDTGFRKPHPAMFDQALALAGREAREYVFIGNAEELDIEPAAERGMRTIRVCIEDPVPEVSRADAVVTSLPEAAELLTSWVSPSPPGGP
jgi:putative hydrolase of the HAD superfamily